MDIGTIFVLVYRVVAPDSSKMCCLWRIFSTCLTLSSHFAIKRVARLPTSLKITPSTLPYFDNEIDSAVDMNIMFVRISYEDSVVGLFDIFRKGLC